MTAEKSKARPEFQKGRWLAWDVKVRSAPLRARVPARLSKGETVCLTRAAACQNMVKKERRGEKYRSKKKKKKKERKKKLIYLARLQVEAGFSDGDYGPMRDLRARGMDGSTKHFMGPTGRGQGQQKRKEDNSRYRHTAPLLFWARLWASWANARARPQDHIVWLMEEKRHGARGRLTGLPMCSSK